MEYDYIYVYASIRNTDLSEEIAAVTERFTNEGHREMEMKVPQYVTQGNYSLRIEGKYEDGVGGPVFYNETSLIFDTKQISVFIQTDKVYYNKNDILRFRVIPVLPNLMPVVGTMDLFVKEYKGVVVKRWLAQAVNNGVIEKQLQLQNPIKDGGSWSIEAHAYGHVYSKSFSVYRVYVQRMLVNVTMPPYVKDTEYGLAGVIHGVYFPSWLPIRGNGTMEFYIEGHPRSNFYETIPFFEEKYQFVFTMNDLRRRTGVVDLSNKAVKCIARIYDYEKGETREGMSTTIIQPGGLYMYFVEGNVRTFKPNMPFDFNIAITQRDGSSPSFYGKGGVDVNILFQQQGGGSRRTREFVPLPDDHILRFSILPETDDELITTKARYSGEDVVLSEITMLSSRTYSERNYYIRITSSTEKPKVNHYMVFTVRTNVYVDKIYYQLVSQSNIVVSDTIAMVSRQKTFSVALSRDMMPSSRMIVSYIKHGEVVADSLSFFVEGTGLHKVDLTLNRGKDFSGSMTETIGTADPGTWMSFNAINYYLYSLGGRNFITEEEIEKELLTYDSHTNVSASVTWRAENWETDRIYFKTQTYGIDANTTFVYAGLHVFTDANMTTIPNQCNGTLGWLRCYDSTCYRKEKLCDNYYDCLDGADEMGCNTTIGQMTNGLEFNMLSVADMHRHMPYVHPFTDVSWSWTGAFTKPTGDSYAIVHPPKQPITWVVSAVSMSRDYGLGVATPPYVIDFTRDLYCQCEYPKVVKFGEQIGIQLWLTSNADYTSEILVTLYGSDGYKFVSADGMGDTISHYSPKLLGGDIQTMVNLFPGECKYVHMPIVPLSDGEVDFTITAENFRHTEGCSGTIEIAMDGVPNGWHTPYFVDLVKYSQVIIPDIVIPVPERWIVPEQRNHLYVPGSGACTVQIVGDVIGPGFYREKLEADELLGLPRATSEDYFFEFTQNLWYLKYFKATDQLTYETQTTSLDAMNYNYMQMLRHKQDDGGYAMFYRDTNSSLWLTAHFFNQLKNARDSDWENHFYIPVEVLNDMAMWMISYQNSSCGAFIEPGPHYLRAMFPKLTTLGGVEGNWNISLTAHVVIALSGDLGLTGEAARAASAARDIGASFLATTLNDVEDAFDLAITTWALHTANNYKSMEFFRKLKEIARAGTMDLFINSFKCMSSGVVSPTTGVFCS
ncbi:unnamed protein product [Owenia fusiformis]|uniref:Uncharacterized protein n=1 Tax=Owenia fusiformis TaxID=6347 RepID=A0A8J1T532_OWEFU|nr:unnamed protein product [Owenia fusiformis]